jgi:RNA polymerase II subunit A C-terminal domain phosphatase
MSSTPLNLPDNLPYPIQIVSHDVQLNDSVTRGARLLTYSFTFAPKPVPGATTRPPETRFGTWDTPVDGILDQWGFSKGQSVTLAMARSTPAATVKEPCTHEVQVFGLCAHCGKDMTM